MDPQQRILLELVYEGVEAAGYSISQLRGSPTGVFVGQMTDDYRDVLYRDPDNIPRYTATGISRAILANRISYFFDWRGPSENIDTACSSSLVALHHAVQSLRAGESKLAVAAGVNLILGPETYIAESKVCHHCNIYSKNKFASLIFKQLSMLSPTGRSRMFDANADGYARGEGFVTVVVKTLRQAIIDHDHIECVIRETGMNQDGHTSSGLTLPSVESQTALIRSTYNKSGLDYTKREDRCQYFEAHGTGTPAGDPKEAEAIRNTFFSPDWAQVNSDVTQSANDRLYVGSIKTIVGHTEGAAGLAALLKASLAVQHGRIPPNMHFQQVNPALAQFYHPHLHVPTRLVSWPDIPEGSVRRASVNSFGFGGTNVHVIIESWARPGQNYGTNAAVGPLSPSPLGPITLSARTRSALYRVISALSEMLKRAGDVDMRDLAWTLHTRRNEFPTKASFAAADKDELIEKLDAACARTQPSSKTSGVLFESPLASARIQVSQKFPLRILGVFTGQGAQWPNMGASLYARCESFRNSITNLEESLFSLPGPDQPTWRLSDEILAPAGSSRIHLPEVTQPLTTAVQIGLVDVLRRSNVTFAAVVGHSSGEIAASYAAGRITASDAIRIAYYRGLHTHLARSPTTGKPGKMMAVGMDFETATELCHRDSFRDRICVAAYNSRSSITLSGDAEAIEEAKALLDEGKIFARILKIDTAYHSNHVKHCVVPYAESLHHCNVEVQPNLTRGRCEWYSSVHGSNGRSLQEFDRLEGPYWVENLVKPVRFHQAIDRAVKEAPCFDMILEVGPHPAMKGPVLDTVKGLTGIDIPYHGTLKRNSDDVTAFSDALGWIWKNVHTETSAAFPNLNIFMESCSNPGERKPRLLETPRLPSYSWDHGDPLFQESQQSRRWRRPVQPIHELLGRVIQYGHTDHHEMHWRNILKLNEAAWLWGHKFQHQVIFPAAGYVSMAVEAARSLAASIDQLHRVTLVELQNMKFHKAMSLDEDSFPSGVEVTFVIRVIRLDPTHVLADYACHSGNADSTKSGNTRRPTQTNFTGRAKIILSNENSLATPLPPRIAPKLPLSNLDTRRFYSWASWVGLQYSGDFLAKSIQRRLNTASVYMERLEERNTRGDRPAEYEPLIIHPATLDVSFHGVLAAYCSPDDGRMCVPYLPSSIDLVRVKMARAPRECTMECIKSRTQAHMDAGLVADCYLRQKCSNSKTICGDVDLFCALATCHDPRIQIQGLTCSALATSTSMMNERQLFARHVWKRDLSAGLASEDRSQAMSLLVQQDKPYDEYERTAYFFLRELCQKVSKEQIARMDWNSQCYMDWAVHHILPTIEAGRNPRVRPEWCHDSHDTIMQWKSQYPNDVDLQLLHALGPALPMVVTGMLPALQVMMEDDRIGKLYKHGSGCPQANQILGIFIEQLSHRYPRMRILEIGAGTGASTATALESLCKRHQVKGAFESYTFTDVSAGFFETARKAFASHEEKMRFRTLDIERSPLEQGFEPQSFDLLIASNVLHTTRRLADTIANCKALLKPGGQLFIIELTADVLYLQLLFGVLPGWWMGREDGRQHRPTISESEWDAILRRNGFSGVDHLERDCNDSSKHVLSVMVTQAVDPRIEFLRQPIAKSPGGITVGAMPGVQLDSLLIVNPRETSSCVPEIARVIQATLSPIVANANIISNWDDFSLGTESTKLGPRSAVVCLSELDQAVFHRDGLIESRFHAIQSILNNTGYVLWVTSSCRGQNPYANMMVGAGRSVMMESSHLSMQFVDIVTLPSHSEQIGITLSEVLLRTICLQLPEYKGVLWSSETEIAFENNHLHIPRILADDELNFSVNTGVEPFEESRVLDSGPVEIIRDKGCSWILGFAGGNTRHNDSAEIVQIRPYLSSLYSILTTDAQPIYLSLGSTREMTRPVLAMTHTNASILKVPRSHVIDWEDTRSLSRLMAILLCESIFLDVRGVLWLHDADEHIQAIASEIGSLRSTTVFLTTSDPVNSAPGAVFIHENISLRALDSLIPDRVQMLAHFGATNSSITSDTLTVFARQRKILIQKPVEEARRHGRLCLRYGQAMLMSLLEREIKSSPFAEIATSTRISTCTWTDHKTVSFNNIHDLSEADTSLLAVVDWTDVEGAQVPSRYLSFRDIFSAHKTYFLIGLTGEVGLSLVEWMVENGAQYFALASRKPIIHAEVITHLSAKGANIRVFALDVSDSSALQSVHQQIVSSMPPIGGVANAAMVLSDKAFGSMSWAEFQAALRPKVDGSINLDELFCEDDLEFFILFSSMASFVGNPGQSNYGAANMFMASLVEQRRQRGLAGSVIHLGLLQGLGHFSRSLDTGSNAEAQLRDTFNITSFSETDLHIMFGIAILTGRTDSGLDPGLLMGFDVSTRNRSDYDTRLRQIPLFSHFASDKDSLITEEPSGMRSSRQSVESLLAAASSHRAALIVLEQAFTAKLSTMLQASSGTIDGKTSLVALGIDSLVAVEVRSWFLKEMAMDMPVLKILSGATLTEICLDALAKFSDFKFESREQEWTQQLPDRQKSSIQINPSAQQDNAEISTSSDISISKNSTTEGLESIPSTSREIITASPPRRNHTRGGPMSYSQARLYFLHQYLEDKSTYNVGYTGQFYGSLDFRRLRGALYDVSMHHESLRSSYFINEATNEAVQIPNAEPRIELCHQENCSMNDIHNVVNSQRTLIFDIEHGQVMKVFLLSRSTSLHHLVFVFHHIALDLVSWLVFINDLHTAYSGLPLPHPVQQAIELSTKERRRTALLHSTSDIRKYWDSMDLDSHEPLPLFPFAKTRNREILRRYETETIESELDPQLTKLVQQAASSFRVTAFHVHLSTLAVFLSRCLKIDMVNIGILEATRPDSEDADTMGHFVNTIPVRFCLTERESFSALAQRTRDTVLAALAHSMPFDMILDQLQVSRSTHHHPLFQAVLNFRQGYTAQSPLGAGNIQWETSIDMAITSRNPYDIAVDVSEVSGRTLLHWTVQKYMYKVEDAQMMMKWYVQVLEGLCHNNATPMAKVPVSNNNDLQQAFSLGCGRTMEIGPDWQGTLVDRIDRMAREYPGSIALVDEFNKRLSYLQMIRRSHQIAYWLLRSSPKPGQHIGVILDPSADQVCTFLAILRLGLVYIPLDLNNHVGRLSEMVLDCRPQILICSNATRSIAKILANKWPTQLFNLERTHYPSSSMPRFVDFHEIEVPNLSVKDQIAVMLYTSGSTGTPKGVLLSHANLLEHTLVNATLCIIRSDEIVLQQSPLGFDLTLDQTFSALASGGTLVIVGPFGRGDPAHLASLMLAENVTYTLFVTSEYLSLLNYGLEILKKCSHWRLATQLGEKFTPQLRAAFRKLALPKLRVDNAYGPAEGTISCARGTVSYSQDQYLPAHDHNLWPMPNYTLIVVDEQMGIVPVGFPGEICIAGAGVSIGYLNRPVETTRQFVDMVTDFVADGKRPVTRFYRTGDHGRLLKDGSFQIFGRLRGDGQVKIRGHRVELNEISDVIMKSAGGTLENAAASYRVSQDDEVLVAFIIYDAKFSGDRADFANGLKLALPLPAYMRPAMFVEVQHIPVNVNGKRDQAAIDRLEIPFTSDDSDAGASVRNHSKQLSDLELQIKHVWEEVLPKSSLRGSIAVSSNSDFFQVGGNSMSAIKLRSLLESRFGMTISLVELFQSSTLSTMSAHIQNNLIATKEVIPGTGMDWNADVVALASNLAPPLSDSPESVMLAIETLEANQSKCGGLKVMLTGSTGFLGTEILQQLADNPAILEIHCVAIRPDSDGLPRHVAVSSTKILEYTGKLEDARLGLSEEVFQHLAATLDLIIHNGAAVSFLKSYQTLRAPNLISTKTLAELAIVRRIPLHFVSSATVASVRLEPKAVDSEEMALEPLSAVSVAEHTPSHEALESQLIDGYTISKWAGETLLERIAVKHGLPLWIHRPASVLGEGASKLDVITALIAFSLRIGSVPILHDLNVRGCLDLVDVGDVARDLVRVAVDSVDTTGSTELARAQSLTHFVHHCSKEKVQVDRLREYLQSLSGQPLRRLPMTEWLELGLKAGLSQVLYDFFRELSASKRVFLLPAIV